MTREPRQFQDSDAVRAQVPLLVGNTGASNSGKTFSSLRLAVGMQQVRGGDIYVVDTESKRALHYADKFKFKHVPFVAPFGSLDYLDVLRHCEKKKATVIVVDSMSHEHEGAGGYLELHDSEIDRFAGGDESKKNDDRWREKQNFRGWIKPAAHRRKLINTILQIDAAFIFNFRAKEKTKPVEGGKPLELGWMPIAGEEFVYELTVNFLLTPNCGGVPELAPTRVGEKLIKKLPEQFKQLIASGKPISEEYGRVMAEWAKGACAEELLAERAAKLIDAITKAANTEKLTTLWNRASELRADLREASPKTLNEIELVYSARAEELEAASKR